MCLMVHSDNIDNKQRRDTMINIEDLKVQTSDEYLTEPYPENHYTDENFRDEDFIKDNLHEAYQDYEPEQVAYMIADRAYSWGCFLRDKLNITVVGL